jgi:hypothetical protein
VTPNVDWRFALLLLVLLLLLLSAAINKVRAAAAAAGRSDLSQFRETRTGRRSLETAWSSQGRLLLQLIWSWWTILRIHHIIAATTATAVTIATTAAATAAATTTARVAAVVRNVFFDIPEDNVFLWNFDGVRFHTETTSGVFTTTAKTAWKKIYLSTMPSGIGEFGHGTIYILIDAETLSYWVKEENLWIVTEKMRADETKVPCCPLSEI